MLMNDAVRRTAIRCFKFRGFLSVVLVLMALLVVAMPADAKVRFSAIAVDARTGKVLFDQDADGIRHPASLTKVMTLYLLFEDIKAGKLTLASKFTVSKRAAGMAPSKLGLKPGATISAENTIKALVTKSANDMAAAIAENLEGSESAFAARMTRKARAIGMSRSVYKNASGLPNPAQVTTARDQATLGLRIQRDFPEFYHYFRLGSFTYNGRTIRSHNRLLGRFEGTDGIKTGYIRASGFNLITSAKRGSQRIVGVVMGGKSGGSRDTYMKKMLATAFPKCVDGTTIAALAGSSKGVIEVKTQVAAAEPSKMKPKPGDPVDATAEGDDAEDEAADAAAPVSKMATVAKKPDGPRIVEARLGEAELPAKLPFQVKLQDAPIGQPDGLTPAANWDIQIGAFPNKRDAQRRLQKVRSSAIVLKGKQAFTVTVQKGQETIYRARFSGFSEQTAKDACKELNRQDVTCLALPPQS